jgi:hypothetical protein
MWSVLGWAIPCLTFAAKLFAGELDRLALTGAKIVLRTVSPLLGH